MTDPMPPPGPLARYTLTAPLDRGEREVLTARLWAAGAAGVWDRGEVLVAWFDRPTDDAPGDGSWDTEPDRDWQAAWKAGLGPVVAGDVAVMPSWLAGASHAPARHRVVLDPGRAFGTGHHPTTVLCLEALQEVGVAGRAVLDVGTGTGVLAIAAALLGAARVRGVDVDPDAVEVAAANAEANGVAIELGCGSVGGGAGAVETAAFDVVVANLLTDTVTRLAPALVATARPGGTLVVSGISHDRRAGPLEALAAAGVPAIDVTEREGWIVGVGARS